jgi:hypothetical protein
VLAVHPEADVATQEGAAASLLAIGPLNTAGQGYQWAAACSKFLDVPAFSFANSRHAARRLTGPSHKRTLHHRVRPALVKRVHTQAVLAGVTHFLDESFVTITGDHRFHDLNHDLDWLRARGTSTGVVFHGSDIRSPVRHLMSEPFSYFRLLDDEGVAGLEESTSVRRRLAVDSGLPLFVSTPDLLLDLPQATWLPLVVDASAWSQSTPAFREHRLRVLHVPSHRNPPIKGTSYVDPVLTRLALDGVIEYVNPSLVHHERMPELVGSVDVVIDQILTGSYGVAAVEAMAAGRLVIGNVGAGVRERVATPIPVVDCTPESLEQVIREVVSDRERYAATAARGPAYVAKHHSGEMSADALRAWLCRGAGQAQDGGT